MGFLVLAAGTPSPSPTGATPSYETIGPGFTAFIVLFLLALATVLLIRSMVGHLRKVRYSTPPGADDAGEGPGKRGA
jgi:hypothetical protein